MVDASGPYLGKNMSQIFPPKRIIQQKNRKVGTMADDARGWRTCVPLYQERDLWCPNL